MNNHSPQLNGIYDFMSKTYEGNWQYRWGSTPYMTDLQGQQRNESILAHQWSCIGFWFHLRRTCPHLNALINTVELYELLWSHDIGETFTGDISQVMQMQGNGADKHIIEKSELERISATIASDVRQELIQSFEMFELPLEQISKLEILLAKLIDTIQGNHFALVYGNNLSDHTEIIAKIVNKKFVRLTNHIIQMLLDTNHSQAAEEVRTIALHHLQLIQDRCKDIVFEKVL